jgi:hypothetical protein
MSGLNKFPPGFDFRTSKKVLEQNAQEVAADKARLYIVERYEKFIAHEKPYFQVILTDYNPPIRVIVIGELLERFPNIGYRAPTRTPTNLASERDQIMDLLLNMMARDASHTPKKQEDRQKVFRLTSASEAALYTHFLVALTDESSRILETYNW